MRLCRGIWILIIQTCLLCQFGGSLLILIKSGLVHADLCRQRKQQARKLNKISLLFNQLTIQLIIQGNAAAKTKCSTCPKGGWSPRPIACGSWSLGRCHSGEAQSEIHTPQWSWSTGAWCRDRQGRAKERGRQEELSNAKQIAPFLFKLHTSCYPAGLSKSKCGTSHFNLCLVMNV